jgi:small GTP-binding protein
MSLCGSGPGIRTIIIGDSGVGKTKLTNCLCRRGSDAEVRPTVGVEYQRLLVGREESPHVLDMWDTAGQEEFRALSLAYFRQAKIALVCYAINSPGSLSGIEKWWRDALDQVPSGEQPPVFIWVGTKHDLVDSGEVPEPISTDTVREKLAAMGVDGQPLYLIETSAVTHFGISRLLKILGDVAQQLPAKAPTQIAPKEGKPCC